MAWRIRRSETKKTLAHGVFRSPLKLLTHTLEYHIVEYHHSQMTTHEVSLFKQTRAPGGPPVRFVKPPRKGCKPRAGRTMCWTLPDQFL